jgi:PrgI family protein
VPTHLNLPDQVLTVWSLSLTARQLLLLLVGGGLGGTVWQHLAALGHYTLAGQVFRLLVAILPFLLVIVLACYQYAGRSLEVWLIVLARFHLRPKRYLWRSIRANVQHLYPLLSRGDEQDDEPDLKEWASLDGTHDLARSMVQ